jgi:hypothetical protein
VSAKYSVASRARLDRIVSIAHFMGLCYSCRWFKELNPRRRVYVEIPKPSRGVHITFVLAWLIFLK